MRWISTLLCLFISSTLFSQSDTTFARQLHEKGLELEGKNEVDSAIFYYKKSRETYLQAGDKVEYVEMSFELGRMLERKRDRGPAEQNMLEVIDFIEKR